MKRLLLVAATALVACTAAFADDTANRVLTHPTGNHVSCKDFGYPTDGVFAENGVNGVYNKDHTGATVPVTVTIRNYVAGTGAGVATFDFSSTSAISAVFVKAGNGPQNLYTYGNPVGADQGLASPKSTISHVLFCYCGVTATTTWGLNVSRAGGVTVLRWKGSAFGYNVYRDGKRINKSLLHGKMAYRYITHKNGVFRLQVVAGNGSTSWFDGR